MRQGARSNIEKSTQSVHAWATFFFYAKRTLHKLAASLREKQNGQVVRKRNGRQLELFFWSLIQAFLDNTSFCFLHTRKMNKLFFAVAVVTVLISGAHSDCPAAVSRQSTPAMINQLGEVKDWLNRLHSVLAEDPQMTSSKPCPCRKVQLGREPIDTPWGRPAASSATSWANFTPSSITIDTSSGGVLVTFFGGHFTRPAKSFQARFLYDNSTAFQDSWGAFYIDAGSVGLWRPFCFSQMYKLPKDRPQLGVQLQTKSSSITINGGGLMAAAFPPPAFLSSIRASSATGSSNQSPYSSLAHTIEVHSNKALLIMAANGRIRGRGSGNTSLSYTVDGVSPVDGRSKNFGHYFVASSTTGSNFIPMGLYQLAEVSRGTHTVQLEGSGSPFDLNYVTSQITTIPISDVQLRTVTADWEIDTTTSVPKPLITAEVFAKSDSILVVSSTFRLHSSCRHQAFLQFNVDGKHLYASTSHPGLQLGTWYEHQSASLTSGSPIPGSLLTFARVGKGKHSVQLVSFNYGGWCPYKITGAALQVGAVPEYF